MLYKLYDKKKFLNEKTVTFVKEIVTLSRLTYRRCCYCTGKYICKLIRYTDISIFVIVNDTQTLCTVTIMIVTK